MEENKENQMEPEPEPEPELELRLIDMNNDDDFLVDFPLHSIDDFRLSVSYTDDNVHERFKSLAPYMTPVDAKNRSKVHLKNEHMSISDSIEPSRPSYLRKSLAWDDAFFTSAGVLDLNELTFINKGLNVADIKQQKHGAKSTINRKAAKIAEELSAQNKMKIKRNSNNKTATIPRSDKRDIKHISRSCDRLKSEDQSKSASWITYDVKKNNKATTNESAKHAMLCKKPIAGSISCDMSPGYLSCPKTSSPKVRTPSSASYVTPTSAYPFAATKTNRRSKLCASAALSRSPLSQLKKEEMESFNNASAADAIQGSNLVNTSRRKSPLSIQSVETNSPTLMNTKDTTESNKRLKPSELRQPLPTLGFFDEGKTASPTARIGLHFQILKECTPPSIRKTPRNGKSKPMVASSNLKSQWNASKRVADICSNNSRKITSQMKKQDDQKTVKGKKKQVKNTEMEVQVNDLSRYFDIIDLNKESNVFNLYDNSTHARAPLVDKTTAICNKFEESLAFSTKSSMNVMLISKSKVSDKENSPAAGI